MERKPLDGEIIGKLLIPSASFSIPAASSTVAYDMEGITADHWLLKWNFSTSAENQPPVSLTWTTYDGYFTIANTGGTTSESIRPIFGVPGIKEISTHTTT